MKLTEQQLAQMFQNSKNTGIEGESNDSDRLYASADASAKRLAAVEEIANNSTLSASYQIMNQLQDWTHAIGTDIDLSLKPKFSATFMSWFKPSLATAAMVTAVYFVTPNMTSQLDNHNNIQQNPDQIMYSSSFEENRDVIRSLSFDENKNSDSSDIISKSTFG